MVDVVQERHGLSSDEMTVCCGLALAVIVKAEAADPEALAIVVRAIEHLRKTWRELKIIPDKLN